MNKAPEGTRWINEIEFEYEWHVQEWGFVPKGDDQYDMTLPVSVPVLVDFTETGKPWLCTDEFDDHDSDDHGDQCLETYNGMRDGYPSPMDDIPWGTPDSWITDNPNSDGFRQSDLI